ncbi:MAG: hypothetical protein PW788_07365 [Micavibrio sp.]|nr:hypothetical protein [Micavibrio sp.]
MMQDNVPQKLQSKGVIRKIVEEGDKFLVSFPNHSGYFKVADNEMSDFLRGMLKNAYESGDEVAFMYDADLNITEVLV